MPNSINNDDLKTLIEYVKVNDDRVKTELTETVQLLEDRIQEAVSQRLYESVLDHIKDNPEYRGPMGYSGKDGADGEMGPIGEQGPMGRMGPIPHIDIDSQNGRIRFQTGLNESTGMAQFSEWVNIKGEKGDTLTWHDLTESQRDQLRGPQGFQGQKGDPGTFPKFQVIPEEFKIRWQVSEDVESPWGDWLDLPQGPQGLQGPIGEAFTYEMFTEEQLTGLVGPQGPQGEKGDKGDKGDTGDKGEDSKADDVAKVLLSDPSFRTSVKGEKGDKGDKGDAGKDGKDATPEEVAATLKKDNVFREAVRGEKGDPGKDADMDKVLGEVAGIEKKLVKTHKEFEVKSKQNLNNDFEKVKNDLISKIDNVRFTRLNELLIPTQAFNVAGDPTGSEVVQEVGPFDDYFDIVDGAPVYIDNPIKASLRGEVYDPDSYIIYADASDVVSVADGIIFKGTGRYAYIYRIGVVTIDSRVIADGPELVPGEYYYLAHPKSGISYSQITVNKPAFGVAQLVGQAISKDKLFVNTTTDPVVLNRTELRIQGSNGSTLQVPTTPVGLLGDAFGDVVWDTNHIYYCTRDYDGVSNIWRRVAFDSTW